MRGQVTTLLTTVLVVRMSRATLTISCFSFPFLDLPSYGFSSSQGLHQTSGANFLSNVGSDTTASLDACFWGVVSFVLLEILPGLLTGSGTLARIQERISPSTQDGAATSTAIDPNSDAYIFSPAINPYLDPDLTYQYEDYTNQDIQGGNRRLDVNVYNYIDTTGSSNPSSNTEPVYESSEYPAPIFGSGEGEQTHRSVSRLQVSPTGGGQRIEVQPVLEYKDDWSGHLRGPQLGQLASHLTEPDFQLGKNTNHLTEPEFNLRQLNNHLSEPFKSVPIEQDYDDIDYTSGGLVTFHSSLSG